MPCDIAPARKTQQRCVPMAQALNSDGTTAAPLNSVMNSRHLTRSPRRRARAGAVAHREYRFGGFELVHALLAIDHAHTLLGTACISSASAALKLRSPGAAPL